MFLLHFRDCLEEEEEEEEEEEPLLIYTAQGSPFRCEKLPVINGSPEHNNVQKLHYTYNHYTNAANNIKRKLCTNKKKIKSCVNRKYHQASSLKLVNHNDRKIFLRSQSSQQADVKGCFL